MGKPREKITSRQSSTVQNFISDQAPKHHEAFQKRGFFDQQRRQYVAWAPHHDLAVALERYQEGNHPSASIVSIRECSWDDVLEEMTQAEDEYYARGQGSLNFVRKGLRKAGDYAPAINPWFDLIPEGDGLKTLSSGLKLLFTIAKQQAEHREKVLGAFRDFVTILDNTQEKRRLFPTDEKLRASAVDLYEAVLCAITKLINLLNHRSWKKRAASFIQGPLSSNEVDEILSDVNKKLDEFRSCLEDLRDRKLSSIYQTVTSGESELHALRLNTKNIEVDVRDVHKSLHEFTEQANTAHLKIDNVDTGVAQISQKIDQLIASHAFEAQTWLYHHLLDTIKSYETQISRSHQTEFPRYRMLQLPQFLEALQVSHLSPTEDLEYVTRQGPTFNAKAQIKAQALTKLAKFQRWLSSKRSDLLLVDGNADPADPSRISPLSVVCATLALSLLKSTSKPLLLHFFCGQHTAMTDPLGGPKGLMRSLVTQLLYSGRRFNIDFIDSRTYRESLEAHSLQHLCDSFGKLIEQLPLDTNVFCMIDGVSLYETRSWLDEMSYVFETINSITLDERLAPVFKVLLTSAHTSRCLNRRVAHSRYLSLQAGALNGRVISELALTINMSGTNGFQLRPVLTQAEGESSSDDYEDD